MSSRRPRLFLVAGAVALAAAPAAARAQFATLEARAGVVPAVGRYAAALGTGQTIGVGASLRFTPTLAVRLDAEANTGVDGGAASPDLYSYMLGLESQLAPARGLRAAPLSLTATLSGGATQLRYGAGAAANTLRPAVGAGIRLTTELTRTFGLFAGASALATLLDYATTATGALTGGGTLVTVPVVAGVRVRF